MTPRYLAAEALVQIEVEDNGPGIPADQMDHLFSPFVSSKKSRGTGLGLPVSQKILSEHGGQILVDSAPGAGRVSPWSCPPCWPRQPTRPSFPAGSGEVRGGLGCHCWLVQQCRITSGATLLGKPAVALSSGTRRQSVSFNHSAGRLWRNGRPGYCRGGSIR